MKRNAIAVWEGSGKEGKGQLSTQSSILDKTPYSYNSRFENGPGTNPEELLAAAHAGCFTMKLSFVIGAAGFTPEKIETACDVELKDGKISSSMLTVKATVPGIDQAKFQECVNDAKVNCPVSQLFNAEISASATLNS